MTVTKNTARLAGFCYLIVIASGLFAEVFVRQKLAVTGDAVATLHKIQAHEMLYRLGLTADMLNFIIGLPVILIVFMIFKQVNKPLALLALFLVIIQTAVIAINLSNQVATLLWVDKAADTTAFSESQTAALMAHSANLQEMGYAIGLTFFGFYCILIGYLTSISNYLPRILGVLYILTGACYIIHSVIMFLSHGFADPLFPYILMPCFVGELAMALWLLIKGINSK